MRTGVSGTYGTGKTALAAQLTKLAGLLLVGARGIREFLRDHFKRKPLDECSFDDLIELGVRRFRERLLAETGFLGGFISDGSSINDWAYGLGHVRSGSNLRSSEAAPSIEQERFELVMDRPEHVFRKYPSTAFALSCTFTQGFRSPSFSTDRCCQPSELTPSGNQTVDQVRSGQNVV